ncbi:Protein of unknown function [Bacillus mobilis]|nr:Protein of unknown function [Bacillus mobilis]
MIQVVEQIRVVKESICKET